MKEASAVMGWLRDKHYQYEVTFGLYVMTTGEKLIISMLPVMHLLYDALNSSEYHYLDLPSELT